jgi:hypothetical protein
MENQPNPFARSSLLKDSPTRKIIKTPQTFDSPKRDFHRMSSEDQMSINDLATLIRSSTEALDLKLIRK